MEIKTKYDIGQKVFWIEKRDGVYQINHSPIDRINIGGKYHEKYELGYTSRGDTDLWLDFEEARKEAIGRQEQTNRRALEIINDYKAPRSF